MRELSQQPQQQKHNKEAPVASPTTPSNFRVQPVASLDGRAEPEALFSYKALQGPEHKAQLLARCGQIA